MKKKFITIFLSCFLFIGSSLESFAFAPLVTLTPELLGTLATIVTGTGIVLSSDKDIYSLGRMFYEKNKLNWEKVDLLFKSAVSIGENKVVHVGKDFLDICKASFDSIFNDNNVSFNDEYSIRRTYGLPLYHDYFKGSDNYIYTNYVEKLPGVPVSTITSHSDFEIGNLKLTYLKDNTWLTQYDNEIKIPWFCFKFSAKDNLVHFSMFDFNEPNNCYLASYLYKSSEVLYYGSCSMSPLHLENSFEFKYKGSFDWNKVRDKIKNDSLDVYVPGNVSSLPGVSNPGVVFPSDVSSPPYDLPNGGVVNVPNVSNPGIDLGDSVAIPGVIGGEKDVVGEKDSVFDIAKSLVVPSEGFLTSTVSNFANTMQNKLPFLDLSNFKNLCINGVAPKKIDVNIMGVNGTVFDPTYLNKIVGWLRPLVSALVGLCLIYYNYRQVYRLIRGTYPLGLLCRGGNKD